MSLTARRGLLHSLAKHEVRFVLIGGMAVIAHGYERATRDVDIVYETTFENCERLADALRELRAEVLAADELPPGGEVAAAWLAAGGHFVFATEQGQLDVLSRISAGDFQGLSATAVTADLRDGLTVLVMSYEDLLDSKEDAGRDRDLLDIKALREVREESFRAD